MSIPIPTIMTHPYLRFSPASFTVDFLPFAGCDYTVQIVAAAKTSKKNRRTRQQAKPPELRRAVSAPWFLESSGGVQGLQLAPFAKLSWMVRVFSTRLGGESSLDGEKLLNLGFMDWDPSE